MITRQLRRKQKTRLVGFVFLYTMIYVTILLTLTLLMKGSDGRHVRLLFGASLLSFVYLAIRAYKRNRFRCPTCREQGLCHGWVYVRRYDITPPRGTHALDAWQCNYDLECRECGFVYQKKLPSIRIFRDIPQEIPLV